MMYFYDYDTFRRTQRAAKTDQRIRGQCLARNSARGREVRLLRGRGECGAAWPVGY